MKGILSLSLAKIVSASQEVSSEELIYFNCYGPQLGRSVNFDSKWKFNFGDVDNAKMKIFDDSLWRTINLPHDYSIEQEFTRENGNEGESGYIGGGIGWYRKTFTLGSDFDKKKQICRIDFDGVYMDSTVYINGIKLGNHPYGYTPFSFDLTKYLTDGENVIAVRVNHQIPSSRWYSGSGIYRSVNLVFANNVHVDLFGSKIVAPELKDDIKIVKIEVKTEVKNEGDKAQVVKVKYTFNEKNKDGSKGKELCNYINEQTTEIGAKSEADIFSSFTVNSPKLWSVDEPNIYIVTTEIIADNNVVDEYTEDYGFRFFAFDPKNGFSLNGKPMKLKGVSMHHDQGSIGSIANKDAQERQMKILKEMGTNAIRVTHNPASHTLIDLANFYGMLLIEESFDGWHKCKNGNKNDYARFFNVLVGDNSKIIGSTPDMKWSEFDVKMMIKRGVNSPAIIGWSLGNEIWEGTDNWGGDEQFVVNNKYLLETAKKYDNTRVLTTGDNYLKTENKFSIAIADQNNQSGGIVGLNYASSSQMDKLHKLHSEWKLYSSESSSAVNSRGIYYKSDDSQSNKELSSYDEVTVNWGKVSSQSWYDTILRDFIAGEFVWTGFDYIGEPTFWNEIDSNKNRAWPNPKNSFFGIVDTAGLPKDRYYFYQSQWREDITTLHVLPAWDSTTLQKKVGDIIRVDVYSNADKVKLFLETANGEVKEVGSGEMNTFRSNSDEKGNGIFTYKATGDGSSHKNLYYTFNVPFEEGRIFAEAYLKNDEKISQTFGVSSRKSAGKPHHLKATANKEEIHADGKSLVYLQVDVVDENNNIVPSANNLIRTSVTGEGIYLSMDNGRQIDVTKYSNPYREAFSGSVIAIVESTTKAGKINIKFESEGLVGTEVTVNTISEGEEKLVPVGVKMSKNYYVKVDSKLELPKTIELEMSDGTSQTKPVSWKTSVRSTLKATNVKTIKGVVDDKYNVWVNVYSIESVGGIFSYSQAGIKGSVPTLPTKLELYNEEGQDLGITTNIDWNMPPQEMFQNNGIVSIPGNATFFGKTFTTVATVSIRDKVIEYGANVASGTLRVEEDRKYDDTLKAINDEIYIPEKDPPDGKPNPTIWSNRAFSQTGGMKSNISLIYGTQTILGRANIHFVKDDGSLVYADRGTTKIFVSETGQDIWKQVEYDEVIGEEKGNVQMHEFTFKNTEASTCVKFEVTNSKEAPHNPTKKASTGIVEVELITVSEYTPVCSDAVFETITINGKNLTKEEISSKEITIIATRIDVNATSLNNGAITIFPLNKRNQIRILVVSEDKTAKDEFVISYNNTGDSSEDDNYVILITCASIGSVAIICLIVYFVLKFRKNSELPNSLNNNLIPVSSVKIDE